MEINKFDKTAIWVFGILLLIILSSFTEGGFSSESGIIRLIQFGGGIYLAIVYPLILFTQKK